MTSPYQYIAVDYDPFQGKEIIKIAPSTESQKEIYVTALLGGDEANLAYNESITLALSGQLNTAALAQAFEILVQRHEGLRSAISKNGETIIVYKSIDFKVSLLDKSSLSQSEKDAFVVNFKDQEVSAVFDLNKCPLIRATVITLSALEHLLIVTGHHIVLDGWSIGVVLQEISKIYSGLIREEKVNLDEVKQITEYAKEEVIFQRSQDYKNIEQYWLNKFDGKKIDFDFPTDFEKPQTRTYKSKRLDYTIDKEIITSIKSVGAKNGVTFVSSLMIAFELLISKISGINSTILGVPTAGQSITGNYNLISHCVNLLPIRSEINNDQTFAEHLKRRNNEIFEDYENQQFTFGSLLKNVSFNRNSPNAAILPISFNVDLGYDQGVDFWRLKHVLISNPRKFETFDIFLNIGGTEDKLMVEWSFNTQLFKDETIEQYQSDFVSLLKNLALNPNKFIRDINLDDLNMPTADRPADSIAELINQTAVSYPKERPLDYFLRNAAAKHPNRIAVSTVNSKITYKQLNERSNKFAHWLQTNGIEIGDKIGLALDRTTDMMVAIIGVIKAGAVYLPFDSAYPANRVEYMLADAGAKFLLTSTAFEQKFEHQCKIHLIESILANLADCDPHFELELSSANLLYILYTSGSTGKPKGAQIRHFNAVNLLLCAKQRFGINFNDKILAISTISFDISVPDIFMSLIAGAEVTFANGDDIKDPERLLTLIESQDVSFMQATPATWQMILDAGWKEKKSDIKIVAGGEPLSRDLAQKLIIRSKELWNVYGPTETTVYSAINLVKAEDEVITIGKPINNTQIYFLDENLNPVLPGEVGEMYIAGDGVSKGYINNEKLTQERYLPNPFNKKDSPVMYKTGDLGKVLADGNIQCLGRIDNQVKIRGFRIELGEIEENLRALPNISNAVVSALELQPGNKHLIAYVVPRNFEAGAEYLDEIKNWKLALSKVLPSFMMPSFFYTLEKFPFSPNGKVDRNALPNPTKRPAEHHRTAENVTTEKTLNTLISEVAKKYPSRIAVSSSGNKITYQQLEDQSNQFANYLISNGIKVGDRIGLAIDRSTDTVVAMLGVIKSGATYLPFDPSYPTDRIIYMMKDADVSLLITSKDHEDRFTDVTDVILLEELMASLSHYQPTTDREFTADNLLYILHTSGSTGKPKGVQISHHNLVNLLQSVQKDFGITAEDKMLSVTTISFDISKVEIFLPLITGAEVMLANKDDVRNAERLIWMIENENITIMQATPYSWQMILDSGWREHKNNLVILSCGEAMSKDLTQRLAKRANEVWNLYGPTETTVYSTIKKIDVTEDFVTIGKPVNNTQIYFLDDNLKEVINGEIGEICIAGDGVSMGYVNNDMLTKERFIPHIFEHNPQSRVYRTGDLGRLLPNGEIQCLGRIDHQVKIRGFRIELPEIEENLVALPNISNAVVIAVGTEQTDQQLAAFIVPDQFNSSASYESEIKLWKQQLVKDLPAFMIPSFFTVLEKFPTSPNGKIDRKSLPNPLMQSSQAEEDVFIEASTEAEKLVKIIWADALKKQKISIRDNFFEQGGHSLLAVQVMQKIEKNTRIKLPLSSLFTHPTIEKLAKLLESNHFGGKWNSLVKIKPNGSKTPLYLIHGSGLNVLGFNFVAKHAHKEQPVYGLQAQGLDGSELTFTSIEEIAALYLSEILEDNPTGPYSFIGYSLGGILAVEMAKQLKAKGKVVNFVGAVDTYISKTYSSGINKFVNKVTRQPKKIAFFGKLFLTNPIRTTGYQFTWAKNIFDENLRRVKFTGTQKLEDKINDVYMNAFYNYRLTPYDDYIWLFKAQERIYFIDDSKYLGWLPYAAKGLKIREIPGDHANFSQPPNDVISAKIFQNALDEAERLSEVEKNI